jgi:hypothetical protein
VIAISDEGIYLETDPSMKKGLPAQLVPAWMIELGWAYLVANGTLSNMHLLNGLNVKRSSAVCTILAELPGVTAERKPITLSYDAPRLPR